jgi:predicted nicotinamide N-methyase
VPDGPPKAQRAVLTSMRVGRHRIELMGVEDLEAMVDREALLRDEDPSDPPYWAYLWTGAVELARHIDATWDCAGRSVLDLGCGLGLVGIVAACNGARVVFFDRDPDALELVAASAERNRCSSVEVRQGDFTRSRLGRTFDLIVAAEVLYERAAFGPLVEFLGAHLGSDGTLLLSDAHRIDTREFYETLRAAGYDISTRGVRAREEGFPLMVSLVTVTRSREASRREDADRRHAAQG